MVFGLLFRKMHFCCAKCILQRLWSAGQTFSFARQVPRSRRTVTQSERLLKGKRKVAADSQL